MMACTWTAASCAARSLDALLKLKEPKIDAESFQHVG
jgi:hypothetical protein